MYFFAKKVFVSFIFLLSDEKSKNVQKLFYARNTFYISTPMFQNIVEVPKIGF